MDSSRPNGFFLYVPSCVEADGQSRPLGTALSLDAGKHLCHQHLLKGCRTIQQRLPREKQSEVSLKILEAISLAWKETDGGDYEGRPSGLDETPLAAMTGVSYRLRPMAAAL